MDKAENMTTPMHPPQVLDVDENSEKVFEKMFPSMIKSLLYLAASRLDIQLNVEICARFQFNPKQSHLNVVKHIFRYLVGTTNFGLWYEKGISSNLTGYYDDDFFRDQIERESTSGCCYFLGKSLITWLSRKQNTIALSSAKA